MTWQQLLDRRWFALVLVALWAVAYLPHLGTRSLRLEEGRRATPAREMIATGEFAVPTLYGDTYLNKPPLFVWLVAATGSLVGEVGPLAVRIPSVLAALGCAFVALRFAPDVLDRRTRSLAAIFALASATLLDKGTLGEIDATLSFVVAAALKVWWDGNRLDGQSTRSWMAVGLLLGITGLLKGPAGPALFYLTVVPFLVWQRRWTRLFTLGHLACVALAVLPAAAWVTVLLDRGVISAPELTAVWGHQLGTTHATMAVDEPAARRAQLIAHYGGFPVHLLGMLFPGVLWLPFAFRRHRAADQFHETADLQRFLVCGILGPSLVFYLYPESRPRHLMPVFFSAAVLAAVVASRLAAGGPSSRACRRFALLVCLVPVFAGTMCLTLAASAYLKGLPTAAAVLAITGAWSWIAVRMTLRTTGSHSHWSLAMNLCGSSLATWFAINAVIVPWRAPHSPTRVALEAVAGKLSPDGVVYTTRTFPSTGEGYYNLQFHLARDVRAADVEMLERVAPCVAVVTPAERAQLESEGWFVDELAKLTAPGGPPEVHVIRLGRASRR
jgi:4-amino-4-deoxy-L-arabinose transferase-like glycosyltransferase